MLIELLHSFEVTPLQAREIQLSLAHKIVKNSKILFPKLIAGIDVSITKNDESTAAIVVLRYPELEIAEIALSKGRVNFPYIPGLLSFRELPLILEACGKLKSDPDILIVDGQGIAHPRKIGLASHLGLFLNKPTIGCAKSSLYGRFSEPDNIIGCHNPILDDTGNTIGAVLRTRLNAKPIYISIGHNIDLPDSLRWISGCCKGYRLPEPTRLAHLASNRNLC